MNTTITTSTINKHSFDNFIMQCCKSKEWDLRIFLKRILKKSGFRIIEDDYRSRRTDRNPRYGKVHNLLAIRGNPKVCLVAHTDVCRDHSFRSTDAAPDVNPVIIERERYGKTQRIIQDQDCKVQVGGDDRLGVAINTWLALNTGYDLGLLFTTDEEVGTVSADYVDFSELNEFELLVQVDRGNHSNQLVTNIGRTKLCSIEVKDRLLGIAEEIGLPRTPVNGLLTDVMVLRENGKCSQAVNMTCGYHQSYGASSNEYIDVNEARDTMKFVSEIIKSYELNLGTEKTEEILKPEVETNGFNYEDVLEELENAQSLWQREDLEEILISEQEEENDENFFLN
jgi:hypothetical protein